MYDFRGIRPEALGAWMPPMLSAPRARTFNQCAALCVALDISCSSADQGLGTRQFPSTDSRPLICSFSLN